MAQWIWRAAAGAAAAARFGSMKSVTTNLRARLPAQERRALQRSTTSFTEYWDLHTETNGDRYLVVTNVVNDPIYLQVPWMTALHFKKEKDGSKWNPEPCDARF